MAEATLWEYRVGSVAGGAFGSLKDEALEELLNTLGMEGWEVIQVFQPAGGVKVRVIARRLLTRESRRRQTMPGASW